MLSSWPTFALKAGVTIAVSSHWSLVILAKMIREVSVDFCYISVYAYFIIGIFTKKIF